LLSSKTVFNSETKIEVIMWTLSILLLLAYISGAIGIIQKILKKQINLWMIIIGWIMSVPMFFIILIFLISNIQ
jgi:H+/gluconate symporter-like permease